MREAERNRERGIDRERGSERKCVCVFVRVKYLEGEKERER